MGDQKKRQEIAQLKHIGKVFGATRALEDINFTIYEGDIIGLVGANGAGKTTLMKILTGVYTPTEGELWIRGNQTGPHYNTAEAKKLGIACAYQELSLCTNLSVYENFSMKEAQRKLLERPGWRGRAVERSKSLLEEIFPQSGIHVKKELRQLTLNECQMVEICAAVSWPNLNILILDEPTSSLTVDRIGQLHKTVRSLSGRGVAVIYISHKIDEIVQICSRTVIMNSGKLIWDGNMEDTSAQDLVEKMGGGDMKTKKTEVRRADGEEILSVTGYHTDVLKDIHLQVKRGEIIGISGLAGSGQRELIQAIYYAGQGKRYRNIQIRGKTAYISGDRTGEGVFPLWDIADNINLSSFRKIAKKGILSAEACNAHARTWYEKLKFRAQGVEDEIMNLSGGNQQKALIARGLASDADVIVLNDPTCGVDVETKKDIYQLLQEAAAAGRTIIWHSTEDREMEQCGRVLVMQDGQIVEELEGERISVASIVAASFKKNGERQKKEPEKQGYRNLMESRMLMPLIVFLAIFAVNAALRPNLLSYAGIKLLFKSSVPLVFIGLGQMFMVVSGGMDLGNGMALGLVNVVTAFLLTGAPAAALLCLLLVILGYGALGALIHKTKIPPLVVTLGASYIWLGFGLMVSPTPGGKCPEWLASLYSFPMPVIPMPIVLALSGGLLAYWIVMRSKYGIIIRGAGNNAAAVTRAGWSHITAVVITYMISGCFVVLGGLFVTAVANGGDCNAYASYQLLSIAAIVIGGCELTGGLCSPFGAVVGALSLSSITTLLTFLSINSNLQSAVTGGILLLALAFKLLSGKRGKGL